MHDRISVNSLCFPATKLSELPTVWRELGARRVTITSPLIEAEGIAAAKTAVAQAGVAVECVPHPFMSAETLQSGEASWQRPRERLKRAIEAAHQLGARSIELMTGARGELSWEEAAKRFIAATAPCVETAKSAGLSVLLEPTLPKHAGINMTHTLSDTLHLAEMAEMEVCLDFYGCWSEPDLLAKIDNARGRIGLVQVSDGFIREGGEQVRAVPGDGAMPIGPLVAQALRGGYNGVFDLELLGPLIDQEGPFEATRRAANVLAGILAEQGL